MVWEIISRTDLLQGIQHGSVSWFKHQKSLLRSSISLTIPKQALVYNIGLIFAELKSSFAYDRYVALHTSETLCKFCIAYQDSSQAVSPAQNQLLDLLNRTVWAPSNP